MASMPLILVFVLSAIQINNFKIVECSATSGKSILNLHKWHTYKQYIQCQLDWKLMSKYL